MPFPSSLFTHLSGFSPVLWVRLAFRQVAFTHRDVHILMPETCGPVRLRGEGNWRLELELRSLISRPERGLSWVVQVDPVEEGGEGGGVWTSSPGRLRPPHGREAEEGSTQPPGRKLSPSNLLIFSPARPSWTSDLQNCKIIECVTLLTLVVSYSNDGTLTEYHLPCCISRWCKQLWGIIQSRLCRSSDWDQLWSLLGSFCICVFGGR